MGQLVKKGSCWGGRRAERGGGRLGVSERWGRSGDSKPLRLWPVQSCHGGGNVLLTTGLTYHGALVSLPVVVLAAVGGQAAGYGVR